MRSLIVAAATCFAAPCVAQVRTVVPPVDAGAQTVEVFFLNEGTETAPFDPPPTVTGTRPGTGETVILQARDRARVAIASGGFAKRVYVLQEIRPDLTAVTPPRRGERSDEAPEPAAASQAAPTTIASDSGAGTASGGFLGQFEAHEPLYILYGGSPDRVKLQFSFAFRLFEGIDAIDNLRFAYTQRMLWAIEQRSGPFTATTYSPELYWRERVRVGAVPIDVSAGFIHDSTGLAGRGSRDVNRLYLRATARIPVGRGWTLEVAPQVYEYVGRDGVFADRAGFFPDDIDNYWGRSAIAFGIEQDRGLKLSALVRGLDADRPAAEINASYPLNSMLRFLPNLYLFGQLFTGHGESLLFFDEERTRFRLGVAFVR